MVVPYIEGTLCDRELRSFVRHVRRCEECREELETYYIVYKGLMQLDDREELPMNMMEALNDDLDDSDIHLKNMTFFHILSGVMEAVTAAAVMLFAVLEIINLIMGV